jgi:peroxiredoxin
MFKSLGLTMILCAVAALAMPPTSSSAADDAHSCCATAAEAGLVCAMCSPDAKAAVGKPAVNFSLMDLEGKAVTLSDYKDKIVVLTWYDENCPYMKAHFTAGTFGKLAETFKENKDVAFLNIDSNEGASVEKLTAANKENKITMPTLIDADGKVGMAYEAKRTPHCFIIGKDGILKYAGALDNAPMGKTKDGETAVNYITQGVGELLAAKEVSVPSTESYGCNVKYPKKA